MSEKELAWLADTAKGYFSIVEVGSWRGRTTKVLADNTRGHIFAVDTWDDNAIGYEDSWTVADRELELYSRPDWLLQEFQYNLRDHLGGKLLALRMTSKAAASLLKSNMLTFDMIFLDADHSYNSVCEDIFTWRPLLRPTGLLCGHDFNDPRCPEVAAAVRSLIPDARVACDTIWCAQ